MPQVKKICVDSRFANSISKSQTDFRIDLVESILLPDNTGVIVTDISIPHSWYSVESYNDTLYFRLQEPDPFDASGMTINTYDFMVKLTHKNYDIDTLVKELANQMNDVYHTEEIFYGIADHTTATISIQVTRPNKKFWIFSDKDLTTFVNHTWSGYDYIPTELKSCNSVIGSQGNFNNNTPFTVSNPWKSGVVDVLGIHNIYITSPQFGYGSFGPRGERNILKKMVVNVPFRCSGHRELAQRSGLHELLQDLA